MPGLYRRAGIPNGTHIIEEMETESDVANGFAAVQIQIVFYLRLAETILHRPVQHSISAGRRDIELIPPSQRRRIAKRETLEQRSISGNLSGLKGEKQSRSEEHTSELSH